MPADFLKEHRNDDVNRLALLRNRYPSFSDSEWRWLLQQIEGRQRTAGKLPETAEKKDWWYPVRLSCEQCSGEQTALYKANLIHRLYTENGLPTRHMADLTGGMGIDCLYMSRLFDTADYVEQDTELCRLAEHNFGLYSPNIRVICGSAEERLTTDGFAANLIYLDPARRNLNGGKVFRIEDCRPDILRLLPALRARADLLLFKLSPMLDLSAALQSLGGTWDCHVVATANEVKEVLLMQDSARRLHGDIVAADTANGMRFVFRREEEQTAIAHYAEPMSYLYEPHSAILKAGAYKLAGKRFGLSKLDANTHLYTSERLADDFPGRVFRITGTGNKAAEGIRQANVVTRNYVLSADGLRKKLRLQDGGDTYIFGVRARNTPTLLVGERIK